MYQGLGDIWSLSVVGGGEFKSLPIQHIDDWTASRDTHLFDLIPW